MGKTIGTVLLELAKEAGADNEEHYQIVYIEGMSEDWTANDDQLDHWNDLGVIIRRSDAKIVHSGRVSTEPGGYYTQYPMNPKGAARLAFGYYHKCWTFGDHRGQNALVQCGTLRVHRDLNKDGFRTGDKLLDAGAECGINQHTTSTNPDAMAPARVGRWSAGCIVWRSPAEFRKFMILMRESGELRFSSTLLDGSKVAIALAERDK